MSIRWFSSDILCALKIYLLPYLLRYLAQLNPVLAGEKTRFDRQKRLHFIPGKLLIMMLIMIKQNLCESKLQDTQYFISVENGLSSKGGSGM